MGADRRARSIAAKGHSVNLAGSCADPQVVVSPEDRQGSRRRVAAPLAALAAAGLACDLTTTTDMIFDAPREGPATFERVQTTVFDLSCATSGCHAGSASPDLSAGRAYGNIVGVPGTRGLPLVAPGRPDSSYLYLKLLPEAAVAGDRMPPGGPYLEPEVLAMVRAWIERGAPRD